MNKFILVVELPNGNITPASYEKTGHPTLFDTKEDAEEFLDKVGAELGNTDIDFYYIGEIEVRDDGLYNPLNGEILYSNKEFETIAEMIRDADAKKAIDEAGFIH